MADAPFPLAPGAVIGVLGGGQLGRMLALAAARLGFDTAVLTPRADAPALRVAAPPELSVGRSRGGGGVTLRRPRRSAAHGRERGHHQQRRKGANTHASVARRGVDRLE